MTGFPVQLQDELCAPAVTDAQLVGRGLSQDGGVGVEVGQEMLGPPTTRLLVDDTDDVDVARYAQCLGFH